MKVNSTEEESKDGESLFGKTAKSTKENGSEAE
jgi:hypothetical protein